jgi:hypothetical protein
MKRILVRDGIVTLKFIELILYTQSDYSSILDDLFKKLPKYSNREEEIIAIRYKSGKDQNNNKIKWLYIGVCID